MEQSDRGPHEDADRDEEWDHRPSELERHPSNDRRAQRFRCVVAILDREVDDNADDDQREERGDCEHAEIEVVRHESLSILACSPRLPTLDKIRGGSHRYRPWSTPSKVRRPAAAPPSISTRPESPRARARTGNAASS